MSYTKLVVGLTGGIGCGKTTVSKLFAHHHVTVIDTDFLARELTRPGTKAFLEIIDKFGTEIIKQNGHLDRRELRKLVFTDPEKRLWLERLLHPLIREEINQQIAASTSPYCIVVIPLLFETSPNPAINRILVVDAPEELQIKRTITRDLQSHPEIEAIMLTQASRKTRMDGADDIIFNDKGPENLVPQVDALHEQYLAIAKENNP
jgi:dephospho-CoA kinase